MKRITTVVLAIGALSLSLCCSGKNDDGAGPAPAEAGKPRVPRGASAPPAPVVDKRADRGPERSLYSLTDNRLSAHLQRDGGLVVRAGSAGLAKYLRFRKSSLPFELQVERDGKRVARFTGTAGGFTIPLTKQQAAGEVKVWVRSYNANARRYSIRVNGSKDLVTVELPEGWSTTESTIPEGNFREGENELTLFASSGDRMELQWLQVAGAGAGTNSPDEPTIYDASSQSLLLSKGSALAYYLWVPEGARLVGDVSGAGCQVSVAAANASGKVASGMLGGRGSAVELAPVAGGVARLELSAVGCDEAQLARGALTLPGPAPVAKRGAPPKYVVFWVMDSLRADRVPTFMPGARPETPTFDKLAETGAVFLQTYVQGNESRASHASIWSSQYPVRHKMITSKAKLADSWVTLDEVAKQAKLFTSGVSGNGYIISRWGFGTKWDKYRNHIHEGGGLDAEDILARGIKSLQGRQDKPWFLYLGTIDTHVSWRAKEPWLAKYDPKPYSGRWKTVASGVDMGKVGQGKLKVSDRDIEHIRAIYDSNVSYQDQQLDKLLVQLQEWGIRDQTMLIITADHGDEQWEHGRVGHGGSLAESLIHVPLLIHYPPMFGAGKFTEGAEVVDIVPTLADVFGVSPSAEWQGQSLLPVTNGVGGGYPRLTMSSKYEGAHAGRIGPWKLRTSGGGALVYNIDKDYTEHHDLADTAHFGRRFVADALWLLRVYNEQWRKARWGNPANVTPELTADLGD